MAEPTDLHAAATTRSLLHGRWQSQALSAALRLKVIDEYTSPTTAAEVAERHGLNPNATQRLTRLLTCLGVLARTDDIHYTLTDVGRRLCLDDPHTVRVDADHTLSSASTARWRCLTDVVRSGSRPDEAPDRDSSTAQQHYEKGVAQRTMAAAQEPLGQHLTRCDTVQVMGRYATAVEQILAQDPFRDYAFTIVNTTAPESIKAGAAAGETSAGIDLILGLHWLCDLDDPEAVEALTVSTRHLNPRGIIVLIVAVVDPENPHPLVAYRDIERMLTGPGRERTIADYASLAGAAGMMIQSVEPFTSRPGISALTLGRFEHRQS